MTSALRILVVDDEMSLRSIVSQVLREDNYDVAEAASGEEALAAFEQSYHPLIITDIKMGGMSGLQLLEKVKQLNPNTQVIIMTSHASLDSAIMAMKHGAYDYLVKPFEDISVITTVANRAADKIRLMEENQRLLEEIKKKNAELEVVNRTLKELAIRDGLTGLYNHRYFQEAFAKELIRARRYGLVFSLLFIDVDHFKHYNDAYGHPVGDNLLRSLTRVIKDRLRASDFLARYGGEEFVIILPETPKENAFTIAETIRQHIADHSFEGRETQPLGRITVSLGISTFPTDGEDGTSLIKHADEALYRAKNTGRNHVSG
ncbi:MAG: diguanylate cyclase [bacterium]